MNAIGYATIDVVANCNARTPASAGYFTDDLRFDNVLTGDYEEVEAGRDARGNALVHIRAGWLANGCTPPVPPGAQIGRALAPTP